MNSTPKIFLFCILLVSLFTIGCIEQNTQPISYPTISNGFSTTSGDAGIEVNTVGNDDTYYNYLLNSPIGWYGFGDDGIIRKVLGYVDNSLAYDRIVTVYYIEDLNSIKKIYRVVVKYNSYPDGKIRSVVSPSPIREYFTIETNTNKTLGFIY